jgi:hypothetical protein
MHADGAIQVGTLQLGGSEFTRIRSRVIWDGAELRLPDVQSQLGPATIAGAIALHLGRRQPTYEIEGKVAGIPWHSGKVDGEGELVTSGTGSALFDHLRAKGSFEGKGIDLTPLDTYDTVAGSFEWAWDSRNPRLHLTQLQMKSGSDTFQGTGDSQDNGQVMVKLTDGARQIQAAVTP